MNCQNNASDDANDDTCEAGCGLVLESGSGNVNGNANVDLELNYELLTAD